jgi:hypothetical protein
VKRRRRRRVGDSPLASAAPMESGDGESGAHVFEDDGECHRGINLGLPAVRAPPSSAKMITSISRVTCSSASVPVCQ